jgi:Na+/proline symporter
MTMSNKVYDILKKIALVWLPALATLYVMIAGIWGLPYAEAISGTIMAVDTFLGTILGISTLNYNKREAERKAFNDSLNE